LGFSPPTKLGKDLSMFNLLFGILSLRSIEGGRVCRAGLDECV